MDVLEGEEGEAPPVKQVVVGICAMEKKSGSKPMKEILTRLEEFEFIRIVIFPEEVILKVCGVGCAFLSIYLIVLSICFIGLCLFSHPLVYWNDVGSEEC